jgi:uracil phosphoribosyltransferase
MKNIVHTKRVSLYAIENRIDTPEPMNIGKRGRVFIASTPESQTVLSDSTIFGVRYTDLLCRAVTSVLSDCQSDVCLGLIDDASTSVLNVLRGGLNFGIREALFHAQGWNLHRSIFISSQRRYTSNGWEVDESAYIKIPSNLGKVAVLGEVVATGTSLRHALRSLFEHGIGSASISHVLLFVIGGAEAICVCEEICPSAVTFTIVFFEGIFGIANPESKLQIKIEGTDLLRSPAIMAPEFIESSYVDPSYCIERCIIYDAGARSFEVHEYFEDLLEYWSAVRELGIGYKEYVSERTGEACDSERFGEVSLTAIAQSKINFFRACLTSLQN